MKVLYFDCYSGVSGDMILAALLDLGIDQNEWLTILRGLSVEGYEVEFETARRQGISARQVRIRLREDQPTRHPADIEKIIHASNLSSQVKEQSVKIFNCLAEAEAIVHDCAVEEVHFHEVGAVDAIVDVVGTCLALEMLGVEEMYSSPVGVGQGTAKANHGMMPLPPPATLEILRGVPLRFSGVETELATPTGSAILKTLAKFVPPPLHLSLRGVGYGAGSKVIPELPNVLRALLLESGGEPEYERAVLLETNIDNMNPEVYPYVIEKLLEAGAMDAYLVPIVMKKGRPGIVLSALCTPNLEAQMLDIIYRETSTLGVRVLPVNRSKLSRREIQVETEHGVIRGKEARWMDSVRRTPEYEDCRRISRENNVPLQEVYRAFYRATGDSEDG